MEKLIRVNKNFRRINWDVIWFNSMFYLMHLKITKGFVYRQTTINHVSYDYSACLFPEGYLGKDQLYVFNNEDVDVLYYVGMQNEEEFAFRKALIEAEEKMTAKDSETE